MKTSEQSPWYTSLSYTTVHNERCLRARWVIGVSVFNRVGRFWFSFVILTFELSDAELLCRGSDLLTLLTACGNARHRDQSLAQGDLCIEQQRLVGSAALLRAALASLFRRFPMGSVRSSHGSSSSVTSSSLKLLC
jgi:hypothetical protein